MYFVVKSHNEPKPVGSEELAALCAMAAPGFIYFEADLVAPVDRDRAFDLKRETLAQLVSADRSGIEDAIAMPDDFDTADKMLIVLEHETNEFVKPLKERSSQ